MRTTTPFLTTTALIAAGSVLFAAPVMAKDVGDFDVWKFQNTAASKKGEGYVEYKADTIFDNLVQEDIGKLGHVHLDSRLTVAIGVESGPMTILGKLTSTGEVLVLDKDGFLFGNGSVVDTAGFAAIGGTMDTQDLLNGETIADINVSEGASIVIEEGAVVNVTEAGLAAFVAPYITNNGIINAKMGRVTMAAGEKVTLDLYGDSLVEIAVDGTLGDALIEQAGTINAEGGKVAITAQAAKNAVDNIINMSGVINASSATVEGGKIILGGGDQGTVKVSGSMDASGVGQGGDIEVTGQNVDIANTAELAADGGNGTVTMIGADSLGYHGATSADGGFVETSAPYVVIDGTFKVGAEGEVLIDPLDLCVFGAGGACAGMSSVDFITSIRPVLSNGGTVTMTNAAGSGDGDIIVVGDLSNGGFTTTARGTLNMIANDDVLFGSGGQTAILIADGEGLDVNLTTLAGPGYAAPSYVWFNAGGTLITGGGDVNMQTNRVYIGSGAQIDAAGGNIEIDNAERFQSIDANTLLTSGIGTISVNQDADGSIQNAIDAIENTGTGLNTINVAAGTYAEDVTVSEDNFVLKGANAGIAGNDAARGTETILTPTTVGFDVTGQNAVIDGFQISGGDVGVFVNALNAFVKALNAEISNNNIENTAGDAIYVRDSFAPRVHNNAIYYAGENGINIEESAFARIDGNYIDHATKNGIAVLDSLHPFLYDNDIDFAGLNGIDVRYSQIAQISYNDITNSSGSAIWLNGRQQGDIFFNTINSTGADGIHVEDNHGVDIWNNTIDDTDNGVFVSNSDTAEIWENVIDGAYDDGIELYNSAKSEIRFNTITRSGDDGIEVRSSDYVIIGGGEDAANTIEFTGGHGIEIEGNAFLDINNNFIRFTGADGIHVENNYGVDIWSNTIDDTDNGVFVSNSDSAEIWENVIDGAYDDGIKLYHSAKSEIRSNTITRSGDDGIEVHSADLVTIGGEDAANTIEFTGGHGIEIEDNAFLDINHNFIRYTDEDGISIENFYAAYIADNNIYYAGDDGIQLRNGGGVIFIYDNELNNIGYDSTGLHNTGTAQGSDGIHISDISNDSYRYVEIDITGNTIRYVADDGIVVADAEAGLLISDNEIRHVGLGDGGTYGGDAIHVRGVSYDGDNRYRPDRPAFDIRIIDNDIFATADDGIEVIESSSTAIRNNTIVGAGYYEGGDMYGADGIHVRNLWTNDYYYGPVKTVALADGLDEIGGPQYIPDIPDYGDGWNLAIRGNEIRQTGDDGIQAIATGDTIIAQNEIYNAGFFDGAGLFGADGIHVIGDFNMGGRRSILDGDSYASVEILGNIVRGSADDGIQAVAVSDLIVGRNEVFDSGDDGINILGLAGYYNDDVQEDDRQVFLSADWPAFNARVRNNVVENSGGDGVQAEGFDNLIVRNNDVSFSYGSGLYVSGFNNGTVLVDGNVFTENEVGAWFESGLIDLTGEDGNQFIGGRTGLRFAPYNFAETLNLAALMEAMEELGDIQEGDELEALGSVFDEDSLFRLLTSIAFDAPLEGYAPLALVDNDGLEGYGGTIGAQYFDGQSDYFVELANEAFYAPGYPTELNGLDSTYVTPFGTVTPVNTAGILDTAQYNFMESMFYHYPDQNDLGLFSFGVAGAATNGLDQQERIFNTFNYFVPISGDVRVILSGIPTVPGVAPRPQDFAGIEPAAGDEGEKEDGQGQQPLTAEQLNELEAASGGSQNVSCWGDAMSSAGGGKVVSYSFGTSLGDAELNAAATCGNVASAQ